MKSNSPSITRLETELRQIQPTAQPPSDLHRSILCAVRAAKSAQPHPALPLRRWVAAGAFAALLPVCAWWGLHRSGSDGHSLREVDLVLPGTRNMPEQASVVMLSPLSQELEFLNRDFSNAMDFLVASVP